MDWTNCYYLTQGILLVFADGGFLPPYSPLHPDIRRIVSKDLDWHSVTILPPPIDVIRPAGPRPRQLDLMTIECALVYAKHGIASVHYNEALNGVRAMIRELLEYFGCHFDWTFGGHTLWGCYQEWATLGRACGLSAQEVASRQEGSLNDLAQGRGICFATNEISDALSTQLGIIRK